jgi:hypothetical protein
MVRVPVGAEVRGFDSGNTVIVMVSFEPDAGVLVAAVSAVVVASSDEEEPGVHAVSRLYRSLSDRSSPDRGGAAYRADHRWYSLETPGCV